MRTRIIVLITLISLLCTSMAFAAPTKLSQQGRLLDGDGAPLTGSHGLAFTLHDAESDGNEVWREERVVEFEEGYYSLVLGELVPLTDLLFGGGTVWMQLAVDGVELSPRQEVVSMPYALRSVVAESVEGGTVDADEVAIGGSVVIDSSGNWLGTPTDWSELTGVPTDLADGDQDGDILAGLSCAEGQLPKWNSTANNWACANDIDTDTQLTSVPWTMLTGVPLGLDDGDQDTVTTTLPWSSITGVPADIADGDQDTVTQNTDVLAGLACANGEVPKWSDTSGLWDCGADIDTTEPNTDTLADLGCGDQEFPYYNGSSGNWGCHALSGSSTLNTVSSSSLAPAASLSLSTTSASATPLVQAWVQRNTGNWAPINGTGSFTGSCPACGDGSLGGYSNGGTAATTLAADLSYTTFEVPTWQTVTCSGSQPLIIRATDSITIDGTLDLSGASATTSSGVGGKCGGFGGGNGSTAQGSSGEGGGPGAGGVYAVNPRNEWWLMTGHGNEGRLTGGSGGNGRKNSWSNNVPGGGGGAGGGALLLVAPIVTINGTVTVAGGSGGTPSGAPGGSSGSGGALWIRAARVSISGTVAIGNGLLRIDAEETNYTGTYIAGDTDGLPGLFEIERDSSGNVTLTNHSTSTVNAALLSLE
jgi:hypothetical protein